MWYSLSAREKIGITSLAAAAIAGAGWVGFNQANAPAHAFASGVQDRYGAPFLVHVAGSVGKPGVITATSRMVVSDAIRLAGGATSASDTGRINLAAHLLPNSRLYVPSVGEAVSSSDLGPYSPGFGGDGIVHLNTATEEQLDTLPGVGPATARAIISYRSAIGGFRSVEQLMDIKGIGPSKMAKIRGHVSL